MKKVLFVVVLAVLIGAAYTWIKQYSHTDTQFNLSPDVTLSPPKNQLVTLPVQTAQNFYMAYLECLKNPPKEAGDTVSEYCQSHNSYGSDDLSKNLELGGIAAMGADPILCAQNPPETVKATEASSITDTTAHVEVNEKFSSDTTKPAVDLELLNNVWKVVDVKCPE
jgi:hypothetical protein